MDKGLSDYAVLAALTPIQQAAALRIARAVSDLVISGMKAISPEGGSEVLAVGRAAIGFALCAHAIAETHMTGKSASGLIKDEAAALASTVDHMEHDDG